MQNGNPESLGKIDGELTAASIGLAVEATIIQMLPVELKNTFSQTRSLMEFGFTSLMLMELREILSKELSIELPTTFLFEYVTAEAIIKYLIANKIEVYQDWLYEIKWHPSPVIKPIPFVQNKRWIILLDESSLCNQLSHLLKENGQRVVTVKRGKQFQKLNEDGYEINPQERKDFLQLFEEIHNLSQWEGIINLWGYEGLESEATYDAINDFLKTNCEILINLANALELSELQATTRIWVINTSILTDGTKNSLVQSPCAALCKVILEEYPKLRCTHLSLEAQLPADKNCQLIVNELNETTFEPEIAYQNGERLVARLVTCELVSIRRPVFSPDACYLISGGLQPLGLKLARWYIEHGAKTLILLDEFEITRAIWTEIDQLKALGAKVVTYASSFDNRVNLEYIFESIKKELPPLKGVIHSAGVLDHDLLMHVNWERSRHTNRLKIAGSWNLHELTQNLPLDHFILFSSSLKDLAPLGKASHSIGNSFLDALSYYRKNQGLPCLSIDWGPWDLKYVYLKHLTDNALNARIKSVHVKEGLLVLDSLFYLNKPQIMAVQVEWAALLGQLLTKNPLYDEVALTLGLKKDDLIEKYRTSNEDQHLEVVLSYVQEEVRKLMDLSPRKKIDCETPLDPLQTQALRNKIESDLNWVISFPLIALGEKPNVSQFSEVLKNLLDTFLKDETQLHWKKSENEPIAIIGMACRFPGAKNYREFWDNLVNGVDSIQEIPSDRWDWKAIYGDPKTEPGKTNVKWGGFIEDVDKFDPLFFNISPKEAAYIDPQHRIFLQTSWHAMEDAGYSSEMIAGQKIGVYAGVSKNDYAELMRENGVEIAPYISTGTVHSILTNRVSYILDLHGPSESVDTACSSALVALHSAIRDLRNGECNLAFVGGVNAILSPTMYISHTRSGMLSDDGHCKTFDESANGYVRAEGVGVLLIKPLRDALKDGDAIHAVIRGIAVNHGGKSTGLTAPNVAAQAEVVQSALKDANIDPDKITCIEVHGTGTPLGDPIEVDGLKKAFINVTQGRNCILSAVKSNMGHLESAAGIAGIIKMVLELKNHAIPSILHFKTLNPRIHLEGTPFTIATAYQEWNPVDKDHHPIPRCGGVSSFGMGGANGHVILEESPRKEKAYSSIIPKTAFPVSAKKGRLLPYVEELVNYFDWVIEKKVPLDLEAIAYTLQTGRNTFEEQVVFFAESPAELKDQMELFLKGEFNQHVPEKAKTGTGPKPTRWAGLPGYPFLRLRCWFEGKGRVIVSPPLEIETTEIHEGNRSEIGIRTDRFFLKDHIVAGKSILPGVMYLEIVRSTAEKNQTGRRVTAIRNVNWIAPIEAVGDLIHVTLKLEGEGLTQFNILVGEALKCTGELVYDQHSTSSDRIEIKSILQECPHRMEQKEIYEKMLALGLKQGPSLRVMTEFHSSPQCALGKLKLNPIEELKDFVLHPSLMDGVYQTVVAHHIIEHPSQQQYLPYALESVEWYKPLEKEVYAYVEQLKVSGTANLLKYRMKMLNLNGEVLVQFEGFARRPIRFEASPKRIPFKDIFYRDIWKEKEATKDRKTSEHVLLFTASEALTEALSEKFSIISVGIGTHFEKSGNDHYTINPASPKEFHELLNDLKERGIILNEIVYAWEMFDLVPLLLLTQALMKSHCYQDLLLLYIYTSSTLLVDAQYAMAAGFGRTLIFENPKMELRSIETDLISLEERAAIIAAELNTRSSSSLLEISYTHGIRKVREVVPAPEIEAYVPKKSPFKSEGSYLITGGAGGLGQIFAKYLAENYKANLILIGRSKINDAINKIVDDLKQSAASVHYLSADVTDADSLQKVFETLLKKIQSLDGVIHAAGMKKDSFILQQDEVSFAQVIAPKVKGALSLDALTKNMQLDFMVLFSSIASIIPNQGQSNYAAANSFLDRFAKLRRKKREGVTLAINWPLWASGGMQVTPEQEEHLKRVFGMDPLPTEIGIQAFEHLLSYAHENQVDQIIVISGNKLKIMQAFGSTSDDQDFPLIDSIEEEGGHPILIKAFSAEASYVNGFSIGGKSAVPGACFLEMARQGAEKIFGNNEYVSVNHNFWPNPLMIKEGKAVARTTFTPSADHIDFEISSISSDNQKIINATGILAKKHSTAKPKPFDLQKKMNEAKEVIKTEVFYNTIHQNADLRLAGNFRPVQELYLCEMDAVARLTLPSSTTKEKFVIQPIIFTGLEQSLLVYTALTHKSFHPGGIRLMPVSIEAIDIYASFPDSCLIHILPQKEPSPSNKIQRFDAVIYNDQGKLVAHISGNTMRITPLEMPQEVKAAPQGEQTGNAEAYIKNLMSQVLGIKAEDIDSSTDFERYGVTSQMIVELNTALEKDLGPVSKTLFFEFANVNDLARYFNEQYKEKFATQQAKPEVEKKANNREPVSTDIAIIGMSGRFPGAANLEEFWINLTEGKDSISEKPLHQELYHSDLIEEEILSCKWGGSINDVDKFDPELFGIAPKEGVLIDPQERLFLKVAWEALQDARFVPKEMSSEQREIGVFVGVIWQDYQLIALEESLKGNPVAVSSLLYSIANRVSYTFNLTGPSLSVDTACSSSLTALHLACQSLITGETRAAIVGGVNLNLHPMKYAFLNNYSFLSDEGKCRSYGEGGSGYVPGEGIAALILKPLSAAIKDGDTVYAVIKGTAINHGGKTRGFTVPNPSQQAEVILKAIKAANIDPRDISYVEGHGTGTSLGDPVEIRGLELAYSHYTNEKQYCSIGSVKSNIGHLEGAAGIASIIKVVLQMQHKMLVPSLHSEILNKNIDFSNTPFYVQRKLEPWESHGPLLSAVSSFGAGGSYAHVILEEPPGSVEAYENRKHFSSSSEKEGKYWIENRVKISGLNAIVHPLLGEQHFLPNHEIIFLGQLNLSTLPYLKDHQIYKNMIMPGAGYLEMMIAAAAYGTGIETVHLRNVSIESVLAFSEESPTVTQILMNPVESGYEIAIYSKTSIHTWNCHARGKIETGKILEGIASFNIEAIQVRCSMTLNKKEFYTKVNASGIHYGDQFQVLDKIWVGSQEALAELKLSTDAQNYFAHPSLLDGCLQLFFLRFFQEESLDLYLPIGCDDLQFFAPLEDHIFAYWQQTEITENGRVGNLKLCSLNGTVLISMEGIHCLKTTAQALSEVLNQELKVNNWLYDWSLQEHQDEEVAIPNPQGNWLVIGNGKICKTIAEFYDGQGATCKIMNPEELPKSKESFITLLNDKSLRGILHLNCDINSDEVTLEDIEKAQQTGTETLLYLSQALVQLQEQLKIPLYIIKSPHFAYSPMNGLFKTLMIEHPELDMKLIDLDDKSDYSTLYNTLFSNHDENMFSLRENRRYVPRLTKFTKKPELPIDNLIKTDGSYLITGGLGGIGLTLAEWLVEKGAKHIILTGRREIDDEMKILLKKFNNSGVEFIYKAVDISIESEVKNLLESLLRSVNPLKGIFHLAGILQDDTLMDQNWEHFKNVFAAKVYGSYFLHHYSKDLDLFVMFSSIASSIGNPGQSNYAAANAFMDGLCEYRRQQGLNSHSISWGPWAEVGMAKSLISRHLKGGLIGLNTKDAMRALDIALHTSQANIIVANINWKNFINQIAFIPSWLLNFAQKVEKKEALLEKLESGDVPQKIIYLKNFVIESLKSVLGIADAQAIDEKKGFFDMGLDSLMAVELKNLLQKGIGKGEILPSTVVFDQPTVEKMTRYLGKLLKIENRDLKDALKEKADYKKLRKNELNESIDKMNIDDILNELMEE